MNQELLQRIERLENIINMLVKADRYVFERPIGQGSSGLSVGKTGEKLGFLGATPIVRPTSTGITGGVTGGGGTTLTHVATFTGGSPYTTAITISDIVAYLKAFGLAPF